MHKGYYILGLYPVNLVSGVAIGYQVPGNKKYFCAYTNKNCRVWSEI